MVDMAHFAGLVAAGEHPSPVPHADVVTTTTHKTLCGPRAGMILCKEEYAQAIDKAVFPGQQGGPLEHVIAAKAVCLRIAQSDLFRERQRQTIANAKALGDALQKGGLDVLTGGTDVHLVLVDLGMDGLNGKEAEDRLAEVGITVNRNAIPFDQRPPMQASGLRIGTPALTTRGFLEEDLSEIGDVIVQALAPGYDDARREELSERTRALMELYPLYAELSARRLGSAVKGFAPPRGTGCARFPHEDLDRHDCAGARARVPADHPAPAGARPRGRGDRARLRADARAARAARDRAHGVRPPRRRVARCASCARCSRAPRAMRRFGAQAGVRPRGRVTARTTWRSPPGGCGSPP